MTHEQTSARLYSGPGRIQSFGVLFVADGRLNRVAWCSANSGTLLGIPPDRALRSPLDQIVGTDAVHDIGNALSLSTARRQRQRASSVVLEGSRFTLWVHISEGWPLVELEPAAALDSCRTPTLHLLHSLLTRLETVDGLDRCLRDAAVGLRDLTGFERVLIYRLDSDERGAVVAEARDPELTSLLGHRLPGGEGAKQKGQTACCDHLRVIAALDDPEVPLVTSDPTADLPDLAQALLHGVSPADREHLGSIEQGGFMTARLVVRDRQWGAVDFHHGSNRLVDSEGRAAVEIVLKFLALQIERRSDEV